MGLLELNSRVAGPILPGMGSSSAAGRLLEKALKRCNERVLPAQSLASDLYEAASSNSAAMESLRDVVVDTYEDQKATFDRCLANQVDLTAEVREAVQRQLGATEAAVDESHNLSSLARGLEQIALEARLLSVNAKVQSANASEGGRSIQVIASSVRDLSKQLANYATQLDGTSEAIGTSLPQIAEQTAAVKSDANLLEEGLEKLRVDIDLSNQGVTKRVGRCLEQCQQVAIQLSTAADNLLMSMQGFDEIGQLINAAIAHLTPELQDPTIGTPERLLSDDPFGSDEEEVEEGLLFL